jgi:hypothetical protein
MHMISNTYEARCMDVRNDRAKRQVLKGYLP